MEHLWSPAGATGGNRYRPTATVSERMVSRGSTDHPAGNKLVVSLHNDDTPGQAGR
jgi:hypothetical protein